MKIEILIVEDEILAAEVIKAILQRAGYSILAIVDSGAEALHLAEHHHPQLVLMDVTLLDVIDGIETANQIHTRLHIPIIYLTANDDSATLDRIKSTEPVAYILKPFNQRELLISIEIALHKHVMEQRLAHLNTVLYAIRELGQVIMQASTRESLLQQVCAVLTQTGGYQAAWMALGATPQELALLTSVLAPDENLGITEGFPDESLLACARQALEQPEVVVLPAQKIFAAQNVIEPVPQLQYEILCARLTLGKTIYGALSVLLSSKFSSLPEEHALFKDAVDDIAFALYRLALEDARQQAEEALKVSETRYRELFNTMSSGVIVLNAIENGQDFLFADFNRAGEGMENVPKQALLGQRVSVTFPAFADFGLLAIFQRVWQTGMSAHYPITQYQDGRIIGWRETDIYKLSSGEIVVVYEDITERKRAEEALRESEARYRAVFEEQTELICRFRPDKRLTFVNEVYCRCFGKCREELLGQTFLLFIQPEDDDSVHAQIDGLGLQNPSSTGEHRIIWPNGESRWHNGVTVRSLILRGR
jgi:PAS domain S-box-containing protein